MSPERECSDFLKFHRRILCNVVTEILQNNFEIAHKLSYSSIERQDFIQLYNLRALKVTILECPMGKSIHEQRNNKWNEMAIGDCVLAKISKNDDQSVDDNDIKC